MAFGHTGQQQEGGDGSGINHPVLWVSVPRLGVGNDLCDRAMLDLVGIFGKEQDCPNEGWESAGL